MPQFQRVKRGMTRTFQINTLFPGLTVLESVIWPSASATACATAGTAESRR